MADVISVLILEADATVIVPDKVAAADELLSNLIAPFTLLYPKPFIVIGSGIVSVVAALISNAAPLLMLVAAAANPNASALVIRTIPEVIDVVPA